MGLEAAGGRQAQAIAARGGHNGLRTGMLGRLLGAGHQGGNVFRIKARARVEVGQHRLAGGQRAGLVGGDHAHAGQALQRLAPAQQHAELGAAATGDQDRHRRGQAHRAGAGDHQHRDRMHQCLVETAGGQPPGDEGQRRQAHHDGHEHAGDAVHRGLDRQLAALGLLDQGDDPRQRGLRTDGAHAYAELAGGVEGAGTDRVPRLLVHRQGLAAEHGFVHCAVAIEDLAIGGDALARAQLEHVAGLQLLERDPDGPAVAAHARGLWLQRDQPGDRGRGAATRARFQPAPGQYQGDDHRGRLVVDVCRAGRQQGRCRGGEQRVAEGGQAADRHQRVHFRRAAQQGRKAMDQEAAAGEGEDQHSEQGLQPPQRALADRRVQPVVEGRHQVAAHLQHEHRQRQRGRQQHVAAQLLLFVVLAFAPRPAFVRRGRRRLQRPARVAGHRQRHRQRIAIQVVAAYGRGAGGQVEAGRFHAGLPGEHALGTADAGRAVHALHRQRQRGRRGNAEAGLLHRRHQGLALQVRSAADHGAGRCQVDAGRQHAGHTRKHTLQPRDAGRTGHAGDWQGERGRRRNRLGHGRTAEWGTMAATLRRRVSTCPAGG